MSTQALLTTGGFRNVNVRGDLPQRAAENQHTAVIDSFRKLLVFLLCSFNRPSEESC